MKLAKLHGLGNDFLIAAAQDSSAGGETLSVLARELCNRHTGIGADGVLFFQPTVADPDAQVSALIYNADGSRAEMSGNGTRCLAAYLIHTGTVRSEVVCIRTVAGIRTFTLESQAAKTYLFKSTLGSPVTDPAKVPVSLKEKVAALINYPLAIGRDLVRVTISSMGNPHCSTFWPDLAHAPVTTLGPVLERHTLFPNRTNVEFIQVMDRHHIRVRFWERGVGPTLASGTGSSAAAVAAILTASAESPVTVEVELGTLLVEWQPPGDLYLTGPAEYVCDVVLA
jgi:diaminopimelate epimerase